MVIATAIDRPLVGRVCDEAIVLRVESTHEQAANRCVLNRPVCVEGEEKAPYTAPPELGQHTEQVLPDHGYEWAEIESLRDGGVI